MMHTLKPYIGKRDNIIENEIVRQIHLQFDELIIVNYVKKKQLLINAFLFWNTHKSHIYYNYMRWNPFNRLNNMKFYRLLQKLLSVRFIS